MFGASQHSHLFSSTFFIVLSRFVIFRGYAVYVPLIQLPVVEYMGQKKKNVSSKI